MLDDQTLEDMANFLSRDSRIKMLDKLTKLSGKRPREKLSMKIGIAKTHTYRYLPKDKNSSRTVPNGKTTCKIIQALLKDGAVSSVKSELDEVETRLRRVIKDYNIWKRKLIKGGIIDAPLSKTAIRELEKSL